MHGLQFTSHPLNYKLYTVLTFPYLRKNMANTRLYNTRNFSMDYSTPYILTLVYLTNV